MAGPIGGTGRPGNRQLPVIDSDAGTPTPVPSPSTSTHSKPSLYTVLPTGNLLTERRRAASLRSAFPASELWRTRIHLTALISSILEKDTAPFLPARPIELANAYSLDLESSSTKLSAEKVQEIIKLGRHVGHYLQLLYKQLGFSFDKRNGLSGSTASDLASIETLLQRHHDQREVRVQPRRKEWDAVQRNPRLDEHRTPIFVGFLKEVIPCRAEQTQELWQETKRLMFAKAPALPLLPSSATATTKLQGAPLNQKQQVIRSHLITAINGILAEDTVPFLTSEQIENAKEYRKALENMASADFQNTVEGTLEGLDSVHEYLGLLHAQLISSQSAYSPIGKIKDPTIKFRALDRRVVSQTNKEGEESFHLADIFIAKLFDGSFEDITLPKTRHMEEQLASATAGLQEFWEEMKGSIHEVMKERGLLFIK